MLNISMCHSCGNWADLTTAVRDSVITCNYSERDN